MSTTATLSRLREASRPFAALLQPGTVHNHDANVPDAQPVYAINGKAITIGDLRKLADALKYADREPFVTVTQGGSGYFAVLMHFQLEELPHGGFWEPLRTGVGRYATQDEAIAEARSWAEADELEYRAP